MSIAKLWITKRSENSYIVNDILPTLARDFGYPINDAEKVKINDVPIFRPSGGNPSSSPRFTGTLRGRDFVQERQFWMTKGINIPRVRARDSKY